MIKKWEDWLFESQGSKFSCYGINLESLKDILQSKKTVKGIESYIKNSKTDDEQDEPIDEEDIEMYKERFATDLKIIAKELNSTLNGIFVLNLEWDGDDMFTLPENSKFNSDNDAWLKMINDVHKSTINFGKSKYPIREVKSAWSIIELVKPNKNVQTHFMLVHFPWTTTIDYVMIAKKETFEIMEILSSVNIEKAETTMSTDLINPVNLKKLKDSLKTATAVKKYGL